MNKIFDYMVHLYGVIHGISKSMGGVSLGQIVFVPSDGLIHELRKIPKGERVGIERLPPPYYNSIDVDGQEIPFYEDTSTRYWDRIEFECIKNGLTVVPLDDADMTRRYIRKLIEAGKIKEQIEEIAQRVEQDQLPLSKNKGKKIQEMQKRAYRLEAEAAYIWAVEREVPILENIAKGNLHSALIGMAHGDHFASMPDRMLQTGIQVDSYSKDDEPLRYDPLLFQDEVVHARFVEHAVPSQGNLSEREGFVRRYNAATQKRILPEKKPQLIGTWDFDLPEKGLFEIYIESRNGKQIAGKVEDGTGSADFEGELANGNITFVKQYDRNAITNHGSPYPISYYGKLQNGKYRGMFIIHDSQGNEISGKFCVKDFVAGK